MEAGGVICLNGEFVPAGEAVISAVDQGVLYGVGLFETIRVAGGRPRLLDRHLSRLFASAGELGLEVPFGQEELAGMASRTAEENGMAGGGLRLTLTAGGAFSRPAVFITARKSPYREDQYRTGIRAGFSTIKRNNRSPLVRHKTLNYFENIMARREAVAAGWDEAIFLNTSGDLAEGSVSNIFLVDRGKVITPHLQSGLLPGITRRRVLELCTSMQVPVKERRVDPAELARAEECFITNALVGVMPLTRVGDIIIGSGAPGEVTRMIMAGLK
ncbi:MAG: aminotransferase class IV [Bacillota bacterium]